MFKMQFYLLVSLLVMVMAIPAASMAQQETTIITIAVPELLENAYELAIADFEAANPTIQVEIVTSGGFQSAINANQALEDYLNEVADYVSSADVLRVDSDNLTPEATLAGYFLDLSPLASSDSALNTADFYTALWNSFQWENGIWALPAAGSVSTLFYNPSLFDEAGVPYPDASWTLADFADALRKLTQYDADGVTSRPGMVNINGDLGGLFLSLLGENIYDETAFPTRPDFSNPNLETLLTTWAELTSEGVFRLSEEFDFSNVPMIYGTQIGGGPGGQSRTIATLPPGGRAAVNADGFAVSAGTAHPEAAYALARFLTAHPQTINSFFGSQPARRSMVGVEAEAAGDGPTFQFGGAISAEMQAIIDMAFESGLSSAERRFAGELSDAVDTMIADGTDARNVLNDLQATLITETDSAIAQRESVNITVATPNLAPALADDEIAINFGASSFASPFPNEEAWQTAAQAFAESDPEVGYVNLETIFIEPLDPMATQFDCFYMPNNSVPTADLSLLLNLSPLVDSDPTVDRNDFVGNTLGDVMRENQTYALPISIQPTLLRYNTEYFNQAGSALPTTGWTTSQFEDALHALTFITGDTPPFQLDGIGNSTLLMLIAAYGGLPIDYRTNPPTINYTDSATVDAIRQVLDLARDGLMEYTALGRTGGFIITANAEAKTPAIYTQTLNGFSFGGGGGLAFIGGGSAPEEAENTDGMTTFPTGTQYNVASYDVSAAYISATTQYPEACYRFISYLSRQISLIDTMPARRSMIDHPDLVAAQGEQAPTFYHQLDTLLQQPNTIVFPQFAAMGNSDQVFLNFWLNRAFDRYVLEDAILEEELALAEQYTHDYQACTANIAAIDQTQQEGPAFFQQFEECARSADPTFG